MSENGLKGDCVNITAYVIPDAVPLPLVPAPHRRQIVRDIKGMSLCLPVTIANEYGWWMINPTPFTVTWNGQNTSEDMRIHYEEEPDSDYATSHFGFGVLTILVPYIFRTPSEWNVWLRGPSNFPKSGIHALEGIVETDWHNATATMNWRMEQHRTVRFEAGDPLCQIVPVRSDIHEFEPSISEMPPDMADEYKAWRSNRKATINKVRETQKPSYELTYRERVERQRLNLSPWTSG
jgi:hypothetical protein